MEKIDIHYPEYKIKASRERLRSVYENRRYLDRIPVQLGLQPSFFFERRNVSFLEYFHDGKAQVHHQLMNIKWRLENIEEDYFTRESISLFPDYQNIATAANFNEVKVIWDEKNPPRIERFIYGISDLKKLKLPKVTDGICGKKITLLAEMKEEIKNYAVTLNGNPIDVRISCPGPEGPFTDALDLVGENLLVWLYEYPEEVKRFMDLLTSALINFEKHIRSLCDRKRIGISITSDGAEMLSPEMFREFVLPYNQRIFNAFPEYREFHMCGKIDHLIDIIAGMGIDHLIAFGFPNDIRRMEEKIGNKFVFSGGISPVLLKNGTKTAIEKELCRYIDTFKNTGAYILGDGASVAPGTPLENLNLLAETAGKWKEF